MENFSLERHDAIRVPSGAEYRILCSGRLDEQPLSRGLEYVNLGLRVNSFGSISSSDDRFRSSWINPLALDSSLASYLKGHLGDTSLTSCSIVLGTPPLIDCSVSPPILHLARNPETVRELGAFIGWQRAAMQDMGELVTCCSVLGSYHQLG